MLTLCLYYDLYRDSTYIGTATRVSLSCFQNTYNRSIESVLEVDESPLHVDP